VLNAAQTGEARAAVVTHAKRFVMAMDTVDRP